MNPIYWLIATKPYKHLSNHFILLKKEKFMVFTSKLYPGIKSHLINNSKNIEGQSKAQYIVEKVHQVDPASMIVTKAEKSIQFYIENQETLQPLIEKITNG